MPERAWISDQRPTDPWDGNLWINYTERGNKPNQIANKTKNTFHSNAQCKNPSLNNWDDEY